MSQQPDYDDVHAPIEDTDVPFGLKVGVVALFLLIFLLILAIVAAVGGTSIF
jgi:hypothetical protein